MRSKAKAICTFGLSLLLAGAMAQAAPVSGTVTDKTTGKPAAGDTVVLVEPMSGMSEVGRATTDSRGHYSIEKPGNGPYLIKATHQGAGYFVSAPQGAGPADISVYDVAAKVKGVYIEADVIQAEADNGQLQVDERFFVHNTSTPPLTQWSQKSFEIVLPAEAVVSAVGAQRPGGLPTSIKLDPNGPKGHYSFNFPIQPDQGDKDTMFQVTYTLPYSNGKFTFHAQETLPADNVAVLLPKSMTLTSNAGFQSVQADPGVQTFLMKNATPNKVLEFTIAGTGSIPRDAQNGNSGQDTSAPGNQPGGGIGQPINTPDPLSKYKWWILGGLALLLAAAAAFLLRKPAGAASANAPAPAPGAYAAPGAVVAPAATPAAKNAALLQVLKEELFALESEKIAGTLSPEEYAEAKAALETVLRRALKKG